MSEDFNPNDVAYEGIEPGADLEFRKFKPGTFNLQIDDLRFEKDDKNRGVLLCRYSLVDGQNPEIIREDGDDLIAPDTIKPNGIFDRFYFHTPKAIPMFASWLEKMGLSWQEYKNSTDKASYVGSLKGKIFQAIVILDTYEGRTSNKVKKYIKA